MDFVKKILAPTDLSSFSAPGVRYACHLAQALNAEVIVAHAVPATQFYDTARQAEMNPLKIKTDDPLGRLLARSKQELHEHLRHHLPPQSLDRVTEEIVELGEPHQLIIEWVEKWKIDLIVMSTHGRSGLPRAMLGSVTEKVLRSANRPVLAIPSHGK